MSDTNDTETDWPAFAGMLLRGDPDELRASLPDWLRPLTEPDETA